VFQLYDVEAGGIIKYLHPAGLIAAIKATFRGFLHGKLKEGNTTSCRIAMKRIRSLSTLIMGNIGDMPSLTK